LVTRFPGGQVDVGLVEVAQEVVDLVVLVGVALVAVAHLEAGNLPKIA
jgi:hypothetical protein